MTYRNKVKWESQVKDNGICKIILFNFLDGKTDQRDLSNLSVFIVEALASNRKQQKILQANKQFCELFRIKEAHVQGQ